MRCLVEECGSSSEAKGRCPKHYRQWRRSLGLDSEANRKYLKKYGRTAAGRYTALKRAAKDKGLGFDITREDHARLIQQPCVYCHGPLNETGHCLDRMNSDRGYVLDNVVPCCVACNRIKNVYLTHDEMVVAMKAVLELRSTYRS